MINSLQLTNFKPFKNQFLEFRHITLLSGLNSSGKSSVLQSLLLLRQSYQQGLLPNIGLALNGELVCIGTAKDAIFEGANKEEIGFDIIWENGTERIWRFNYDREVDVLNLASSSIPQDVYQLSLFTNKFHYLQAERIGPRTFNEMSDYQVQRLEQIGTRGEYTAHFLSIYGDKDIPNSNLSHPRAKSSKLVNQVEAWIGEVSPGTRLKIASKPDIDLMSFQYSYGDSNPYRATNVGFGISYTLPIIVAVLASEPGTLIIIENPEAHLHPKGQSQMGRLLAIAASCGVQIVIETHSDHVLNGIRLAVHGGKIDPKDVQLHFFQRQEKERPIVTEVLSPRIDRDGRINSWPNGFFDQAQQDLMELL
ncbi:DUF3696 domain-containing protein [Argonema galeatum]|uniref:DUF3696 domain-containing protein n=1 Tax=Argonema galeatum TaxID=2942762 RepID=UPI002012C6EB|nr:DUF3696 domain-containing protein [Argonema galeatum]MCL1466461.1 DUF3696 domain-containing protein [Argonema galeatum A003/A1]